MQRTLHVLLLLLGLLFAIEAKKKHHYEENEIVPLWVNNIGPYANPTETYSYFSLPFCFADEPKKERKKLDLGEIIEGDSAVRSHYDVPFKYDFKNKELCEQTFKKTDIEKFKKAIEQYYYFEMIYDDLPIFGFIGTMESEAVADAPDTYTTRYFLFKHLDFSIEYNGDQVIRVNLTSDKFQELKTDSEDTTIKFTYSAKWVPTTYPFAHRKDLYSVNFFSQELEIHWLSIMNSVVLVILLTGFLAIIIMRILKSDYTRYARADDTDDEDPEDYGWKLVHGDVFRFPPLRALLAALLGNGAQFFAIHVAILVLALFHVFGPYSGGNLYTAAIALYAVTAGISGYVSAKYYRQLGGGDRWAWNIVLTALLFAGPFFCVVMVANGVAVSKHSTISLPFTTILEVATVWLLVGLPLTIVGGISGRRFTAPFEAPCRTKNFPREIPATPWYRTLPCQMLMAGFLPFSAIYIELFYIYSSVWGHSSYTLFGILFLVFIILLIVTACITIALTYFQLSMEDHRWWWNAFMNGGSTGLFIYGYSIFYYVYRSRMSGVLQASFYFGYMAVVCYFYFVMLGTIGFFSSLIFVKRIYRNLKID